MLSCAIITCKAQSKISNLTRGGRSYHRYITEMYLLSALLVTVVGGVHAQQTAQTRVADSLSECYHDPYLMNRNNLPPTSIGVLIDIIRKIEDHPNVNRDLRQIAAGLLHTYRQDGIEYHQPENTLTAANVIPYAPTFHSFHRHRLLISRMIPNSVGVFENNTISSVLKCAMHNMLSTTVDARVRGDEGSCNQLSQYRALRTARSSRSISEDVEILKPTQLNHDKNGQLRQYHPSKDVEFNSYGGPMSARQVLGESQCPILTGVVHTAWGAVSAGNLIAGIAAGAEAQQVPIADLARDATVNYNSAQQFVTSLYPATLSGDLAEAVLIQGTDRGSASISIGTAGNWNSTQAPRYFMLHSRTNVEMTDPEIRGDIDGFVLGLNWNSISSTFSSLKLSQLLDMYYSPRNGVYNEALRACNRRELRQQYITNANLLAETQAFASALDTNLPLRGTLIGGLETLTNSAVNNFQSYATNNMNDMTCVTTLSTYNDFRMKTNLFIALDSSWQYQAVYPAISFLLDEIEVSTFGSSITLLSAFDGSIVINTTFSLADFHTEYTLARHQALMAGVNLQTSFANIRVMMEDRLRNESRANYVGGNSTVLLFLINSGNLQNNELVLQEARHLNESVPDLRVLFATATNQFDNLWNLVRDMHNDIMTVTLNTAGTNVNIAMNTVLERIQQVGRRIINPVCGNFLDVVDGNSGTRQFDDYVEPGYINFYALSANYFFENNDNTKVRVSRSGVGLGGLIICHSRVVTQPRRNYTIVGLDENAITCQTLASSGNVEISLQNACDGHGYIGACPPLYLSVQSNTAVTTGASASCTDQRVCRFPYDIRYQVQVEELNCFSGAAGITASLSVLLTALYFIINTAL